MLIVASVKYIEHTAHYNRTKKKDFLYIKENQ